MKNIMKYTSIVAVTVGIIVLGVVVLKKYANDNLPVFSEDDWI